MPWSRIVEIRNVDGGKTSLRPTLTLHLKVATPHQNRPHLTEKKSTADYWLWSLRKGRRNIYRTTVTLREKETVGWQLRIGASHHTSKFAITNVLNASFATFLFVYLETEKFPRERRIFPWAKAPNFTAHEVFPASFVVRHFLPWSGM